jgi:arginyl-tRNA synthetase
MILEIQARLVQAVRTAVRTAFDAELPPFSFQYPPRAELGDLALTAPFDLAKTLRRKPSEIAERLCADLAAAPLVRRAEVAGGGYVNVHLDRPAFLRELRDWLSTPLPGTSARGRVIVEHTSINPNKSAHVGHLRNAVIGDSFVHILRRRGYEVSVQNYIDDTGVQVADVVVGFEQMEGLSLAQVEALPGKFDDVCWDLYARVGEFYAADPARKALQARTLHEIEAGEGETARLAAHVASRIVDCHLATMERLGIRYDLLARESDILHLHFWDRAFSLLKESGALRLEDSGKSAGCWVLTMEDGTDDDKIIVRSNGTVTYTGKDIAYQLWKLGLLGRDFHYRRKRTYPDSHVLWTTTSEAGEPDHPPFGRAEAAYNVIDVGQSYPQRVVKAGIAALGHPEAAAGSHHLAYEKVVLSPATARALGYEVALTDATVKVSGRKGLGVKADALVSLVVQKARTEVESRDPARGASALDSASEAIAIGAIRYFLLKYGRTKILTFDMDEALAFVGETGPYIQNSVVRARNILAKIAASGQDPGTLLDRAVDFGAFLSGDEGEEVWALLLLAARSEEVAEQTVRSEEVSLLAKHTFALAQAFHAYYQKPQYSVLHAESDDLRAARTVVVDVFLRQMEILTGLLGIPVPERM